MQWFGDTGTHARSFWRRPARMASRVTALALASLCLCLFTPLAHAAASDDNKPTLHIVVPKPAGNGQIVDGPVGANVSIAGTGFAPGASYQIGYALSNLQCQAGMIAFDMQPVAVGSDGALAATFAWPTSLSSIGPTYFICAQNAADATQPPAQSDETFRVAAADSPTISIKAAASTSGGTATPVPDNTFYLGQQITIEGKNFVPASTSLVVYLRATTIEDAAGLVPPAAAQLPSPTPIVSGDQGAVTATVTLPTDVQPGNYVIYLVSADHTKTILPALVASRSVTLARQPTPQPTVTPKVTPTVTPSSQSGPPIGLIAVLGGLSVVLFILGVALLASAAALPGGD